MYDSHFGITTDTSVILKNLRLELRQFISSWPKSFHSHFSPSVGMIFLKCQGDLICACSLDDLTQSHGYQFSLDIDVTIFIGQQKLSHGP